MFLGWQMDQHLGETENELHLSGQTRQLWVYLGVVALVAGRRPRKVIVMSDMRLKPQHLLPSRVWGPLLAPALHNSKKGLKGIAQQKICGSCPAPTTETYVKCILRGSLVSVFN